MGKSKKINKKPKAKPAKKPKAVKKVQVILDLPMELVDQYCALAQRTNVTTEALIGDVLSGCMHEYVEQLVSGR